MARSPLCRQLVCEKVREQTGQLQEDVQEWRAADVACYGDVPQRKRLLCSEPQSFWLWWGRRDKGNKRYGVGVGGGTWGGGGTEDGTGDWTANSTGGGSGDCDPSSVGSSFLKGLHCCSLNTTASVS